MAWWVPFRLGAFAIRFMASLLKELCPQTQQLRVIHKYRLPGENFRVLGSPWPHFEVSELTSLESPLAILDKSKGCIGGVLEKVNLVYILDHQPGACLSRGS
jgi:hypothetical protein